MCEQDERDEYDAEEYAANNVSTSGRVLVDMHIGDRTFSTVSALAREAFLDGRRSSSRPFDFAAHLQRQREFSKRTFGPGARTAGVVDHIRKELREIEADPTDISEWIDVVILALDGAWRAGYSPSDIIAALVAKQAKNEARTWPDWRTAPMDKAIEHVPVQP